MVDGVRRYSEPQDSPQAAHEIALARRAALARTASRGALTLLSGIEMVRADLRLRGLRPGTARWYEDQFTVLLKTWAGTSRLEEFTPAIVERFVERRRAAGVGANSIRHHLRALSRIFNLAIERGLLDRNPVTKAVRPRPVQSVPHVFTWDEAQGVLSAVRARSPADAAVIELLLTTGLRKGEAARLTPASLAGDLLTVDGKRGVRVLPLPPQVVGLLRTPIPGDTEQRRADHVRRVCERWKKRLREPRLHPHALRHTFTSELARRGVPEQVLADLLGHARRVQSQTQHYIAVFGGDLRRALELLWSGGVWVSPATSPPSPGHPPRTPPCAP